MPSNTAIEAYERYAKARDEAGFTDYKVCKACGFGTAVTTNWKKGTYKPKWDKICKIAEVLGADPVWIDRGVASTLLPAGMTVTDAQDYEEFREELKDAEPPQYISVPILGRVAAGEPIFDEGNVQGYTMLEWHKSEGGMYFALEVTGDSMEPLIHKGATVIVKSRSVAENGEICIVQVNGDEATCKRVYKQDDGVTLVSINPDYEPMFFTAKQVEQMPVRIIGKVVEARTPIN